MRNTETIHDRDRVIAVVQGLGQWVLSREGILTHWQAAVEARSLGATDIAAIAALLDRSAANATDKTAAPVEPEWEWIQRNEGTLRENYSGRWVAVLLNRVVAVGDSELEVMESALELGYDSVFTFCVPTDTEPVTMAVCV